MSRSHSGGKIMLTGEKGRGSYNQGTKRIFEILYGKGRKRYNEWDLGKENAKMRLLVSLIL